MGFSGIWFLALCALECISLAFLIIASVTAPAVHSLGLAKVSGVVYGTLGYCSADSGSCSKPSANYGIESLANANDLWLMSSGSRSKLEKIVFIAPIAAGLASMACISLGVSAIMASGTSKSHISSILFVSNLIWTILALISSVLICIVDILIFYPHVTWCAWILVAAAVIPLIIIPLLFLAHSHWSSSSYSDENFYDTTSSNVQLSYQPESGMKEFGATRKNLLNEYSTNNGRVPDIGKTFTASTNESWLLDEKSERESTPNNDNNECNDSYIEVNPRSDKSIQAFSAIESEASLNKTYLNKDMKIPSLDSSVYSLRNQFSTSSGPQLVNELMRETPHTVPEIQPDNSSELTSISRRGLNPSYMETTHQNGSKPIPVAYNNLNLPTPRAPYPASQRSQSVNNHNSSFGNGATVPYATSNYQPTLASYPEQPPNQYQVSNQGFGGMDRSQMLINNTPGLHMGHNRNMQMGQRPMFQMGPNPMHQIGPHPMHQMGNPMNNHMGPRPQMGPQGGLNSNSQMGIGPTNNGFRGNPSNTFTPAYKRRMRGGALPSASALGNGFR